MRDTQDQRMRELAYRLIEMAPEAPPFPEEHMVKLKNEPATARSGSRKTLAFAASLAVALVIGVAATTLVLDDDSAAPPATQAVDFSDSTTTFVSPRNGFSLKYFEGGEGTTTVATTFWDPGDLTDTDFDILETGYGAYFAGASVEGFDGVSIDDEEVDDVIDVLPYGCLWVGQQDAETKAAVDDLWLGEAEITIDGQLGRVAECAGRVEAIVVAGGRLYLFALGHGRSDGRALFDAFAASIDLTPETAVAFDYIADFFDPPWATTFFSPTYGFSFNQGGRGWATPATAFWEPGIEQGVDAFDGVETGYAAYFSGASTEIPDGVSIDEWVDDVIEDMPGGCRVPRSQQAEISIDGQSGRIAECAGRVEATVVAGGRLYFFVLGGDTSDGRAFFDAFAATIDLRPEDAALPQSTP